jgi:Holliday junction resolvase-like predicted endonuclease
MKTNNHIDEWFYEGRISKCLVDYLVKNGYEIIKDNSDNINAKGEDIIASRNGFQEIIEVKGYPTTYYAKGPNKGQPKPTKPKLQAKHWFSEALLSSIFNYQKQKGNKKSKLALALPLTDRYMELISKVEDFFTDNKIDFKVYFIDESGSVIIDNLNRNERKNSR